MCYSVMLLVGANTFSISSDLSPSPVSVLLALFLFCLPPQCFSFLRWFGNEVIFLVSGTLNAWFLSHAHIALSFECEFRELLWGNLWSHLWFFCSFSWGAQRRTSWPRLWRTTRETRLRSTPGTTFRGPWVKNSPRGHVYCSDEILSTSLNSLSKNVLLGLNSLPACCAEALCKGKKNSKIHPCVLHLFVFQYESKWKKNYNPIFVSKTKMENMHSDSLSNSVRKSKAEEMRNKHSFPM